MHSRSLETITELSDQKSIQLDTDRLIKKHIDEISFLFGEDFTARLKIKIASEFKADNQSFIHGDAHLDNFFIDPEKSLIQIVDYDDLRLGDPNADIGRAFASMESWLHAFDVEAETGEALKKSFLSGYSSKRNIENINEINMLRLRLFVIQLRSFFASELGLSLIMEGTRINKSAVEMLNDKTRTKLSGKEERALVQARFAYQEITEYMGEDYTTNENLISDTEG